jgi:hypothetical protein
MIFFQEYPQLKLEPEGPQAEGSTVVTAESVGRVCPCGSAELQRFARRTRFAFNKLAGPSEEVLLTDALLTAKAPEAALALMDGDTDDVRQRRHHATTAITTLCAKTGCLLSMRRARLLGCHTSRCK